MAEKRQDNPLIKVTQSPRPIDLKPYTPSADLIELDWREHWAPKFGLDPKLYGKERAMAMAKATGLTKLVKARPTDG